jgi:hypothetical protein
VLHTVYNRRIGETEAHVWPPSDSHQCNALVFVSGGFWKIGLSKMLSLYRFTNIYMVEYCHLVINTSVSLAGCTQFDSHSGGKFSWLRCFCSVSQSLRSSSRILPKNCQRPLPFSTFPINYSQTSFYSRCYLYSWKNPSHRDSNPRPSGL